MSTAAASAAANTGVTASAAMAGFTGAATRTSILEDVPTATAAASEGRKQALAVQPLGRSSARGARELFSSPRAQDNIDLNGDGKADLLWSGASGDTIAWVMNGKTVAGSAQLLRDANFKPLGTGDFNGDGRTDIVWYSAAAKQTVIWLMNGGAILAGATLAHDPNLVPIAAPDFNGDGKSDLLWYNATNGQTASWLMDGLTATSTAVLLADANFRVTALPDLNGDGKTDILWYSAANGQTIAWVMNGNSLIAGGQFLAHPTFRIVATPDLNGDGKSDLIWYNPATGETVGWLIDGMALVGGARLLLDANFVVAGTPDLNGDGNGDLLWYNAATGQTVVWLMNGINLIGGGAILTDRSFQVVSTSDLNGDGRSDIVWYNESTGQTVVWLMNGVSILDTGSLLTDRNYRLVQTTVQPAIQGLVGRSWSTGQFLEADDFSIRASAVGIDDAGNAISVFIKSDGTRNVLFATRGVPGLAGSSVRWSPPTAIDTAVLPSTTPGVQIETPLITVAPNGNASVTWTTTAACNASTYTTNTSARCNYLVLTTFDAATNAWTAPFVIADTPDGSPNRIQAFNSRGDFAVLYTGWVRTGATGNTRRAAVLWRASGQTSIQRRVFDDATLDLQSLGMDKNGNMVIAGSANQNSTRDIVAYRGNTNTVFQAQEILDQRAATASFQLATVGTNGQAVVVWTQNNGTVDTRYSADITTPSGNWSVKEMEPRSNGAAFPRNALTVTDNGDAIYGEYSNGSCRGYFQRLSRGNWSGYTRFPAGFADCNASSAINRNGDALQFSGSRWSTYDAATNTMVRTSETNTSSVFGTSGGSLGDASFALSVSGIGVLIIAVPYDTLPTAAQPAGDGRSSVINLWGLFLK